MSRLECSGNLCSLGSSNSASASRVAGTTGTCHHAWLIFFVFLVEMGFHHVSQDDLDLLTSRSTRLSLPKCWDYRREPPRPAQPCNILYNKPVDRKLWPSTQDSSSAPSSCLGLALSLHPTRCTNPSRTCRSRPGSTPRSGCPGQSSHPQCTGRRSHT